MIEYKNLEYQSPLVKRFLDSNKNHLEKFSIDKAKDIMIGKSNAKVCTATGVIVRIICVDAKGDFPVIGLIDYGNNERPKRFTSTGTHRDDYISEFDLFIYNK